MTRSYLGSSHLTTTGLTTEGGITEFWGFPGGTISDTIEANVQVVFRTAGTISNLYIRIPFNTVDFPTTISTRKNGTDGNLTITVPTDTTGDFEDITHTDTIASGDLYCMQTTPGATGLIRMRHQSAVFQPDDAIKTVTKFGCTGSSTMAGGNTVEFYSVGGRLLGGLDNVSQLVLQRSGLFRNLGVYVSANTKISDSTVIFSVDLASTDLGVTVPAGITGWFEDTQHIAHTNAFSEVNNIARVGSTGSITFNSVTVEYESLDGSSICYVSSILASQVSNGQTFASPLIGIFTLSGEDNVLRTARFDFIMDSFTVESGTNQIAVSNTWTFRVNETDTTAQLSLPPMRTGIFTSDENVTITTGQRFNTLTVFADQGDSSVCSCRSISFYVTELISSPSTDDNRMFIGAATDGDNEWVTWTGDHHGVIGTGCETSNITRNNVININEEAPAAGSTSVKALANFVSMTGDGFDLNWDVIDTGNAYEVIYIAFGDDPNPVL